MTEAEWLVCTEPFQMLEALRGAASDRKLRLLACGCCRALWGDLCAKGRAAVETAERYADGQAVVAELDRACDAVGGEGDLDRWMWGDRACGVAIAAYEVARAPFKIVRLDGVVTERTTWELMETAVSTAVQAAATACEPGREVLTNRDVCGLVRCCFGPLPFRPVAIEPGWRTTDVVGLARGIYNERAFEQLPILADALMDAGCADADILAHCRSGGPHALGCWAVDLVLGKG